jgi:hypothetical protein
MELTLEMLAMGGLGVTNDVWRRNDAGEVFKVDKVVDWQVAGGR